MKQNLHFLVGMGPFLTLWSTQALSSLGSAMTGFALIVWSYQQSGSALTTALLSVCTYAPYVALSLFAGALSDRWDKRKTMLVCDALAAVGTGALLLLWACSKLALWHLSLLNALRGMMNTVQQPAAEVAATLRAPKAQYPRRGCGAVFPAGRAGGGHMPVLSPQQGTVGAGTLLIRYGPLSSDSGPAFLGNLDEYKDTILSRM